MKKLKLLALAALMLLITVSWRAVPITANDSTSSNIKVYIDEKPVSFNDTLGYPQMVDNRTFLPLRVTAEAMSATVTWIPPSTVESKITDRDVLMNIGSPSYTVNGTAATMDVAPYLNDSINRTYVPVRFIAEGLGYVVDWREVNGVDYVFNFTKGQTATERTAIMDKIAPQTPTMLDRTIGANDTMFSIIYNLDCIGLKTPIIDISSKDNKIYRWVCVSDPGMNTFHTLSYPSGQPVTVTKGNNAGYEFTISGTGYDTPVTKGMKLTYNIYDANNNLVRIVDFQL